MGAKDCCFMGLREEMGGASSKELPRALFIGGDMEVYGSRIGVVEVIWGVVVVAADWSKKVDENSWVVIQSMKDNEVWILVELPPNGKTVGIKWLFKKKIDMDGATLELSRILIAIAATMTMRLANGCQTSCLPQ
ncbi:hypothetical protein Tco_0657174 [Tanacetum coccineum]|uniref:Uncharacterized protein n=1 Tax=Tanacetum coccineum TaxID=301880 RepID=A0ABQ4XBJ1_9ASTR